jgi:hypothetical protein
MTAAPSHIVVVSLENQDFSAVIGNASAPNLNLLASMGMTFTNYRAVTHPSQPNYLALFSGSTQGVTTANVPPSLFSAPTLASDLAAKGLTFTGYGETGADPAHEPWNEFGNSIGDAANFSAFPSTAAGFAALPDVSFITPSNADNMTPTSEVGGGGIAAGDTWLGAHLMAYAQWAQANNSLLIITFDENGSNTPPNQIATIVVGAGVPAGVDNGQAGNQYALLATIESLYGITPTTGETGTAPILDFYSTTPPTAASTFTSVTPGISDPTNSPPQNALAVGANYVVTSESSKIQWVNRTTNLLTQESLYTLFASVPDAANVSSIYDASLTFDSSAGLYVLTAAATFSDTGNVNIDVATSANPSTGWTVATLSTGASIDRPTFTADGTNIYIQAQISAGTDNFVVPLSTVANGASISTSTPGVTLATNLNNGKFMSVAGDNGLNYLLADYSNGTRTTLSYQTYNAATGAYSGTQNFGLDASNVGGGGSNFAASQAGSDLKLDAGDGGIASLAYASFGGHNYVYGLNEVMAAGATQPEFNWFQLDVTNAADGVTLPVVVQGGNISPASLGFSSDVAIFNASIAVDKAGDVLINFTASGTSMEPSDYYMVAGPNQNFGAPVLYQSSTSPFISSVSATGLQRWGLNSSAVADPNNPNGFYVSNEYVTNTGVTIPNGLGAWWNTATAKVSVSPVCFMAGTRVLTPDGESPVESLKRGDLVLTADGVARPIGWLGRQTVSTVFGDPVRVLPIRIMAGALADNVPCRDLLVSPDHALLVDGVLIQAGALVNGTSIVRETNAPRVFVYYHVELDDHSLILAENTPAETFVDNVDRLGFDNWAEHESLYPDGKPIVEMPCPRAKSRRQVPANIRVALAQRALVIGVGETAAVA